MEILYAFEISMSYRGITAMKILQPVQDILNLKIMRMFVGDKNDRYQVCALSIWVLAEILHNIPVFHPRR